MKPVHIWDLPVRLGHWLLAGGFITAWLTADSETWRLVHVYAGATVLAVALYRLLWGFIGSQPARFSGFMRSPITAVVYLKSLLQRRPQHYTGHNPAGGWAILALLSLALGTGLSGWLVYQEWFGDWLIEVHDVLAELTLAVVVIHLAGVVIGSFAHGENLVRAMISGRKQGQPEEALSHSYRLAALFLLAWTALASWWLAH